MNKPFVSSIFPGEILIININNQLKKRIRGKGIRIRQSSRRGYVQHKGDAFILFEPEEQVIFSHPEGIIENKELSDICLYLNGQNIPFRANFKMDFSPSDYMRHLQKLGILKKAFKEISWDSGEAKIMEINPRT